MRIQHKLGWMLVLGLILTSGAACTPAPEVATVTPAPTTWALTPYYTPTPTATALASITDASAVATALPQPSATPFLYEIQKDDTLSVIAYRHSITLNDLLAANPGIDPGFLSIGTTIIIPTGEGNFAIAPTATPFPAQVNQPQCYPTADGGLWCLAVIENQQAQALEYLTASITLLSANGDLLAQQTALPPRNKVDAESAIPVAAFFPAPVPAYRTSHIQLLTALPINDATRYLETVVTIEESIVRTTSALLRGTIEIAQGDAPAQHLIVAAIAYDQEGNPIGIRKWETILETAAKSPMPFEIQVFSLGPPIADVEVISEARP